MVEIPPPAILTECGINSSKSPDSTGIKGAVSASGRAWRYTNPPLNWGKRSYTLLANKYQLIPRSHSVHITLVRQQMFIKLRKS